MRKKIVVVGDGEVGKTCLLSSFSLDQFPSNYVPTIFETSVIDMIYKSKKVEVELWDTAGQEDFDRLRPLTYPETDAIIACYSITNPDSYQNMIEKWIPEVKYFLPKTPIIIAGTKRDLRNDEKTIEKLKSRNLKPLTFEDGCLLANQVGAYGYCECSSRLNEGVYQVFSMAIESSLKYKKKTLNETNKFCLIS